MTRVEVHDIKNKVNGLMLMEGYRFNKREHFELFEKRVAQLIKEQEYGKFHAKVNSQKQD